MLLCRLEKNPLDCSCGLSWLVDYETLATLARCQAPNNLATRRIVELKKEDFKCSGEQPTVFSCVVSPILFLISCICIFCTSTGTSFTVFVSPVSVSLLSVSPVSVVPSSEPPLFIYPASVSPVDVSPVSVYPVSVSAVLLSLVSVSPV